MRKAIRTVEVAGGTGRFSEPGDVRRGAVCGRAAFPRRMSARDDVPPAGPTAFRYLRKSHFA
jgi:hypothetical protein